MDMNSDSLARMRTNFNEWDEAVGVLSAEGKKADGEARTAYQRRLKELRLARSAAQRAFDTLRASTGPAAARAQADMEEAWEAMQAALVKVTSDLHAPPRDVNPVSEPPAVPEADPATPPPIPPSGIVPVPESTP